MKSILSILTILSFILFTGCNSTKAKVTTANNAHQQVNNQRRNFPRPSGNVICHNCRAAFKVSQEMQKQSNGKNYIECPVCHHDYSKSSK